MSSDNPFSTTHWTAGRIPFFFGTEENLDPFCETLQRREISQIVGQHGTGKSTLMLFLRYFLESRHYSVVYKMLTNEDRILPPDFLRRTSEGQTFYFLDGYEQLSWYNKLRFFRHLPKRGSVLITTHRKVWGIPVLYWTKPRFDIFLQTVQRLTEKHSTDWDEQFLRKLFERHYGNFRNAFFELYDLWELDGSLLPPDTLDASRRYFLRFP